MIFGPRSHHHPVEGRAVKSMRTLVVTEKKSVADDFAKVLGGFKK